MPRFSPDLAPAVSQGVTTSSVTSSTLPQSTTPSRPTAPESPSSVTALRRPNTPDPLPPPASPQLNDEYWKTWATLNPGPQSSATMRSLSVSRPIASTSRCQSRLTCAGIGSGIGSSKDIFAASSSLACGIMPTSSPKPCLLHDTSCSHPAVHLIQMMTLKVVYCTIILSIR